MKLNEIFCEISQIVLRGGQISVLHCNFLNIGLRWPIFHKYWVQISYKGLENNLNDYHANKSRIWHQEVAKMRQMQGNRSLRWSKSGFMLFYQKYVI